ncbi:MAG: hypothetical protein VX438_04850, partial [Planctomycetota bacterium]|nr:hypothetical protein [Planctomycetota bacterium]
MKYALTLVLLIVPSVVFGQKPSLPVSELPRVSPGQVGMSAKKIALIAPELQSFIEKKDISGAVI